MNQKKTNKKTKKIANFVKETFRYGNPPPTKDDWHFRKIDDVLVNWSVRRCELLATPIHETNHGLLVWKPNWISNKIQRKCRHFNRKKLAKKFSLDFQIVIRILFFKIEKKLDEISHWLLVWKQNRISNKIQTKISKFQYKEIRQEIKRRLSNEKAIRIGLLQKKKAEIDRLLPRLFFWLIWFFFNLKDLGKSSAVAERQSVTEPRKMVAFFLSFFSLKKKPKKPKSASWVNWERKSEKEKTNGGRFRRTVTENGRRRPGSLSHYRWRC